MMLRESMEHVPDNHLPRRSLPPGTLFKIFMGEGTLSLQPKNARCYEILSRPNIILHLQ